MKSHEYYEEEDTPREERAHPFFGFLIVVGTMLLSLRFLIWLIL